MTKKLRILLASVALLASATTAVLVHQGATASAAAPCVVGRADHFTVNLSAKTITGSFEVKGDAGCTQPVTVMTWYADSDLAPPAYFTTQTIAHMTTQTFGVGVHELTTQLPVCSTDPNVIHAYQADTVATDNPSPILTAPGTGGFYDQTQADGTNIVVDATGAPGHCPPAQPTPPTPPTTPPTAPTPPAATPTTLPKAGAGSSLGLVAGVSGVAALGHGILRRRRTNTAE